MTPVLFNATTIDYKYYKKPLMKFIVGSSLQAEHPFTKEKCTLKS